MLEIRRDPRGYLEVKVTTMSWTKYTIRYCYYDTEKWLRSSFGNQNDVPDKTLNEEEIEWVKKYYLPKLADHTIG